MLMNNLSDKEMARSEYEDQLEENNSTNKCSSKAEFKMMSNDIKNIKEGKSGKSFDTKKTFS